jgi:hypothetical protein
VEVVYDGITGCFSARWTIKNRVQTVAKLLEANPAVAQHKTDIGHNLAHQACLNSNRMGAADCIEVLKLVLARHTDVLKVANSIGRLPAHLAATESPVGVLDFVLGEYPEAATVVDSQSRNLLLIAAMFGPEELRAAKARLLCARYPAMMLQRDSGGLTPLFLSCGHGHGAMARLLCEAGGREAASTAVLHPTNAQYAYNGWLPLHNLIACIAVTLKTGPLAEAADAFRLLLRLYPEAAGTEGGIGATHKRTPYQLALAVDHKLPAYYRRLLLRAAPDLDPAELRRLNWEERRLAMYVAYATVAKSPSVLTRLRVAHNELLKNVVSFL